MYYNVPFGQPASAPEPSYNQTLYRKTKFVPGPFLKQCINTGKIASCILVSNATQTHPLTVSHSMGFCSRADHASRLRHRGRAPCQNLRGRVKALTRYRSLKRCSSMCTMTRRARGREVDDSAWYGVV